MFETARPFLLALAIGLLIGIERERAQSDSPTHDPLGSRSFTLLALLGAVAAHVEDQAVAAVLALFAGAIILAGYFRTRLGPDDSGVGATTEVAAMATFVLGYLARHEAVLSIMLAVITLVVLALKPRIHQFARRGLREAELSTALTFLVIAFVVLPLLPDRPVDPWHLVNPARLWLIFVLIVGIGFGGYIAVRLFGPRKGMALTGLAAGLVSSTAATIALARKTVEEEGLRGAAAIGIVLANVASAAAQLVVIAVIFPGMIPDALPVVGAPVVVGALCALGAIAIVGEKGETGEFSLANPVGLRAAAMLAVILATVLVATSGASVWLGPKGMMAMAALGGATNVHAVTLAVSNLAAVGDTPVRGAVLAILIGFVANMTVKLGLTAWIGGRRLLLVTGPPLIAMVIAGILAYVFASVAVG